MWDSPVLVPALLLGLLLLVVRLGVGVGVGVRLGVYVCPEPAELGRVVEDTVPSSDLK